MKGYIDRYDAGKVLAAELAAYAKRSDVIVLALPRGGVPVAAEIAKALAVPLDIFVVRKLGVPMHEELALGAIASGGITVFNDDVIRHLLISQGVIDRVIQAELVELKRRETAYRGKQPFPSLKDKTIILVDDGIATGATMKAAIKALRLQHPAVIIVAVPVAALQSCNELVGQVEKLVCPLQPEHFNAVGNWYEEFLQTSDEEVTELLTKR